MTHSYQLRSRQSQSGYNSTTIPVPDADRPRQGRRRGRNLRQNNAQESNYQPNGVLVDDAQEQQSSNADPDTSGQRSSIDEPQSIENEHQAILHPVADGQPSDSCEMAEMDSDALAVQLETHVEDGSMNKVDNFGSDEISNVFVIADSGVTTTSNPLESSSLIPAVSNPNGIILATINIISSHKKLSGSIVLPPWLVLRLRTIVPPISTVATASSSLSQEIQALTILDDPAAARETPNSRGVFKGQLSGNFSRNILPTRL
ncbi:hypothetical protein BDP27DRAFT_1433745 [Rhodocollybia butyracea]|uniref:Uncharacterized protein n=1 Tax=Rhodocollybia butyracea TaxID=206335 RepID=A0A9P5P7Y6_9AGAR|nr:hypothetical protein BDP27DRAFT_1433745 [Rhodocollybia butyracea]